MVNAGARVISFLLLCGTTFPSAQSQPDFFDRGISLSGIPTMRKELESGTTIFTLRQGEDELSIRLVDEYAFAYKSERNMSAQWSRALMAGEPVTVRLAQRAPALVPGTAVAEPSLERIAVCAPNNGEVALTERTPTVAVFFTRCVAFNQRERVQKDGELVSEADVVIIAGTRGSLDRFLTQHRGVLYIRVESR